MNSTILVTGGAGFIGSHVCYELLSSNYDVVVIDSLENSSIDSIKSLEQQFDKEIPTYIGKLQDEELMNNVFATHSFDGIIHMAGYKSVKESVQNPQKYYDNNIKSTISLLKFMDRHNCMNLIFSSSATVYGDSTGVCLEDSPLSTMNPYGETKLLIERILDFGIHFSPAANSDLYNESIASLTDDICKYSDRFSLSNVAIRDDWSFISLRYFNPIGAHPSLVIGENPSGIPENLVPYVMKVLSGELTKLTVFGNDYDTEDGTAIRDYIHVVDLAKAHIAALAYQLKNSQELSGKHERFNIGTGKGYSVLDVINVFEKILETDESGATLSWEFGPRRPGDAAVTFANANKAANILKWNPEYNLEDMCRDAWGWWKIKAKLII